MVNRRASRKLFLNDVAIGGNSPIVIQSMTNTPTKDAQQTLSQINRLYKAGCEVVRTALPDKESISGLREIVEKSPIPVIADIHFDYTLALAAIECNCAGIRLNPGNIKDENHIRKVAEMALKNNVVIRVGANSGSVDFNVFKKLKDKGLSTEDAMAQTLVESTFAECQLLEKFGFDKIKVALKSTSVPVTIKASKMFANRTDYPIHLGVTEAGTPNYGVVKSSVGIGALLLDGIGDTIRVSLTSAPEDEVIAAIRILEACSLREANPEIISCPSCGRTEINLIELATKVENLVENIKANGGKINLKKIAVMGCAVNGPGEAKEADIGIAGSKANKAVLFKFGKPIGLYDVDTAFEKLKLEIIKS